jgi:hypothetical protein
VDLELRARGQYFASPLETLVIPVAKLLKPVIERESPMNVDWLEVLVIKIIANLNALPHPESIVTNPHNAQ